MMLRAYRSKKFFQDETEEQFLEILKDDDEEDGDDEEGSLKDLLMEDYGSNFVTR